MSTPRIKPPFTPFKQSLEFLNQIRNSNFSGELSEDYKDRISVATDNSVYQLLPQGVIFPKSAGDLKLLCKMLNQPEFHGMRVSPRGGGTGTNGQSLTTGIMVDVSRHLNKILEVNTDEGWVKVEPGVVLDQLNDHLKPYGYFFAPTLSTSSRATLGGMINTDACGKGSRLYGKTSDHIVELTSILIGGEEMVTEKLTTQELQAEKAKGGRTGDLYSQIDDILTVNQKAIANDLPKLTRFISGYNLPKVYSEDRTEFNLNYLFSGAEGTLAILAEAKLKLTPLVKNKKLLLVKYTDFGEGLKDAEQLVKADPAAIETIDEKILALAKEDEIIHKVGPMIKDQDGVGTKAINLVEFVDDDLALLDSKIAGLIKAIENKESTAFGYYLATDPTEIADLWELRKKGVGLLGNAKGNRKPIAFVEDTVVPPEHLASYIKEFRALLESYGLEYGMFGHVDVGCLHVRPALDMKDEKDELLLKEISDKVADLVDKYGGVIWGEHGKGFRSQYTEKYFGKKLYGELRKIKGMFDPRNQLNPGKIATAHGTDEPLVQVDGPLRGHRDKLIKKDLQEEFAESVNCNGNGACFNYSPTSVICPSYHVTRDRVHSPKGRAALMREWLTLATKEEARLHWKTKLSQMLNPFYHLTKVANSIGKICGVADYSHEVLESFKGCLSCKACKSQCPIKVDVPDFKAKFMAMYYQRYLRKPKDYLIASLEKNAPWQYESKEFFNFWLEQKWVRSLMAKFVGIVDPPCFSKVNLNQGLIERGTPILTLDQNISHLAPAKSVLLVQDAFTSFYESSLVLDLSDLLKKMGVTLYVIPFLENGKALHIKGFLSRFQRVAKQTDQVLQHFAKFNIPMIGIDPAVVLTYRDEYPKILGRESLSYDVLLLQEYIQMNLASWQIPAPKTAVEAPFFGHCTEKTETANAEQSWQQIFAAFGHSLKPQAVGCCGMCGVFGHETQNLQQSKELYEMSWGPKIDTFKADSKQAVATGYSCRSQVKRFSGEKPQHPVSLLLQGLK